MRRCPASLFERNIQNSTFPLQCSGCNARFSRFKVQPPALFLILLAAALLLQPAPLASAQPQTIPPLRVLPPGQLPNDSRLGPLKDLNGYFPFIACDTPDEWAVRAERVRRNLLVATGLWPMPPRTPLKPVIHGKIEQPDYTVEKVYFQSFPGFFVTGNLYRPKGRLGPCPAVLSPHGHWKNGRFLEARPDDIRRQLDSGAERFEAAARSPLQARCVQLARMGCVVFHYDMLGYADSLQIPESLAHGFAKQRPEFNSPTNWGLFSPQAEARLQSVLGLQTWNSIRALDFLCSLPDVDVARIGVTGASGGGTQTFLLCALDPRPAVSFPAVMVSTAMQGGCTCENASLLRVDTGNVEIAALFAPKPLGMTAADDWTKEMPMKGFPQLQQHFAMLGARDNVMLEPLLQFGHNYNAPSRAAMYRWFNRHLRLGAPEPIEERDFTFLGPDQLTVWDDQHPKPDAGPDFERHLLRAINDRDERLLALSQNSLPEFRHSYGGAFDIILGRDLARAGAVSRAAYRRADRGYYTQHLALLRNLSHSEEFPFIILEPKPPGPHAVIWLDGAGKNALFPDPQNPSRPAPAIEKLLRAGVTVLSADLLYQGEFLPDSQPLTQTRKVPNPREAAAYTFGYNYPLFAQRVHDILSLIQFTRQHLPHLERLDLVGLNGAGPWTAAARAQSGRTVERLALDTAGFRFANITNLHDPDFLPGAVKYGDLPALLALGAPGRLWFAGETNGIPSLLSHAYRLAHAPKNVTLSRAKTDEIPNAAASWLLKP